jgi:spermine/spermidine synthase
LPPRVRLVALSFLMLFVELALIRWTGSNVVYLSYFSNFVLLGSFLGIGIGFLRARAPRDLFGWAPVALAAFVAFVLLFPVEVDRSGDALIFFGKLSRHGLPTWVMLPLVFAAVAGVMALIAEGVARTFVSFAPLDAYRLDIFGSLLGIMGFTLLAFLRAPPVVWGTIAAGVFAVVLGRRLRLVGIAALLVLVGALLFETLQPGRSWSPYYKVATTERNLPGGSRAIFISVNGIPHQAGFSARNGEARQLYFIPYERSAGIPLDDVLIVGAGNGTDVSVALVSGARHVDAVEIDPRIEEVGLQRHPDRPYQDPRVDVHIDDGRAFLERTRRRYDLILFALPDSLTLVAGQSSLRLENYLFTTEAMAEARRHLRPHGVFAMYNQYRHRWLVDRLATTLERTYGRPPCMDVIQGRGIIAVLTASADPASVRCETPWKAAGVSPEPARDDYPFLYLRTRAVPGFYLLTLGLILAASFVAVRAAAGRIRSMSPYTDLFFMGAAFLLLETKNVVQFALLFGTTWLVNALVFSGILAAVLGAVEVARRFRLPRPSLLYAALFASVAVSFAVPQRVLLDLPFAPRFASAVALAFAPIFLANLIFAQRFADVGSSTTAFGANLLGAMVGGVIEYASLVTGYRLLLVGVAALYALALLFSRRIAAAA